MTEQKLSDMWQCQSCSCYFPHIPRELDKDVKRCSKCVEVEILQAKLEEMERQFPMQNGPSIPWSLAEKIYAVYEEVFSNQQSLERLAERGGFGWAEVERIGQLYRKDTRHSAWSVLAVAQEEQNGG